MNDIKYQNGIGRRITRYGAILTASGILCKLMLLVYTVLAVDILGKDGFGRIEYFIEMAIIFSVLVDFGLEQTVTREIARARDSIQRHLYPLVLFRIVASFAGGLIMTALLMTFAKPEHTWMLILCTLSYFLLVTNMMLVRAIVRSFEWMSVEGIANIIEKVIHIGSALVVLMYYPKLPLIVLCYSAGALTAFAIYLGLLLKRFGLSRSNFTYQSWYDWQKLALPIGLSSACILLLHREDTAMVNWICGDDETGLYRAPYRFLEGLFLFPQVIAISAYPVFSKLYHDGQAFQKSAASLLRGLFMLSFPIAVGGTLIADEMMLTLTPDLGTQGGFIFKILLWSLPCIYANFLLGTILNATDRQQLNFKASVVGLFCNALLNVPAIYYYGAIGASVVTILSQGLYCFIMLWFTRDFHLFTKAWRYLSLIAASGIMASVLVFAELNWLISIPLGALVYSIAAISLRGIAISDLKKLLRLSK